MAEPAPNSQVQPSVFPGTTNSLNLPVYEFSFHQEWKQEKQAFGGLGKKT